MKKILIDTGPLVALFNYNEPDHEKIKSFLKTYKGQLLTTWPVVTEVSHFLDFNVQAQIDFYSWIKRGGLIIEELETNGLEKIIQLTTKYKDRPMDLADASLILLAERWNLKYILTLDSDFLIYRFFQKKNFVNVL